MEGFREVVARIAQWSFLPLGLAALLIVGTAAGSVEKRRKRSVWLVGLILLAVVFFIGFQRYDWGEVLFNGQLL